MRSKKIIPALLVSLLLSASGWSQTVSGSIAGSVIDSTQAAVPNAKVTAVEQNKRTITTAITDAEGRFVFPQMQPGIYDITAESPGFKKYTKKDVVLQGNDKLSIGNLNLEVGAIEQSVEVTAQAIELQTESGERSTTLNTKQLENIAVNARTYLALAGMTPGIVTTFGSGLQTGGHTAVGSIAANGARTNQNNLTLDGVGNVDTGNNGDQLATVSIDAVSEFKILTSNYQAEYGRSSGAQISVVTKSGTNETHGSGYLYHRHDGLNANNWVNNRDGIARNYFRFNNFGYTIGGPVYLPKFGEGGRSVWSGKNKLYFFFTQEYQRQLRPQGNRNVTMPTALERTGDFSQSVDKDGNKIYIRDYTKGLTCSASNTAGCFIDGGVLNRIPQNRLYGPGLAILKVFPLPTLTGNNGFNFRSQISDTYPRREDMVRIDYKHSNSLTLFGRYVNNQDAITSFYGSFVLGTNNPLVPIRDARPGKALAIGATKTFSSSMINEIVVGFGKNQINIDA